MKTFLALISVLALACFTGCDGRPKPAPSHGGHHHEPPHGGTAVDLGDEDAHLEFVLDAAAGKLTCYVLKPHMSGFQRITQESLELTATVAGKPETLTLKAVANAATGEKSGDTSQFEAQADWLRREAGPFSGHSNEAAPQTAEKGACAGARARVGLTS